MNRFIYPIFFLVLFAACGSNNKTASDKTVFRYNEPGGVSSLDPAFARNLENIWVVNQLYDGLVSLDAKMQVQPQVAKSWELDSSKTSYTFTLKKEVFFHDNPCFKEGKGRAVVADDVVYSLERLVDSKLASAGRWILDGIQRREDGSLDVSAINDTTLTIKLKQPVPQFLSLLAMQYCGLVPKEAIAMYGDDFRANPVGCGPFKFFIWEEGNKLILHKNERYYMQDSPQAKLPYLDAVAVSFIKDQSAALMGMQSGEFDFMSGLDAASKHRVLTPNGELTNEFSSSFKAINTPFLKTDYLGVRIGLDALLDEQKVRKALSMAINREDLVKFVLNGLGKPASSGFVPEVLWKDAAPAHENFQYNPTKAKALLSEVPGLAGSKIVISTTSGAIEVCEYVQRQWNAIGINVEVEILPSSHHREQCSAGNLALFRKSWIADYPDPENFLSLFYGPMQVPAGPNYFFYQNAEYDKLYEHSMLAKGDEREALLLEMQETINEDMPLIPLFYDEVFQLCYKRVENLQTDAMNVLDLSRVRITPTLTQPK